MPISPIDTFNHAIVRAEHFLSLYDILHNSRQRGVRADWRHKFNQLMHWPRNEQILRIDGVNTSSILIIRENIGLTRENFTHDYCAELLRSAIVFSISALDRYLHDKLVDSFLSILREKEEDIPKKLKSVKFPILITRRALDKVRDNSGARPGSTLKKEFQELLHRDYTFQNVHGIEEFASMMGIKSIWSKLSDINPGNKPAEEIRSDIQSVTKRRHQIVHEADLILQTSGQRINNREIRRIDSENAIEKVRELVYGVETITQS